ncbi:MAG TPA: UDP-N-acetylmuramoyl-tripeptide--D-alanyl-D-alanine ligase [Steroidobacteraceae bacterium]|nr:UDP-N-acetylmuramoyl-tripeptide--D-alanyl-D-alanine ligase [Steroidobacteraceae bacterium]
MIGTLAQFAEACGGRLQGEDRAFGELVIDSRRLNAGDLFAALAGEHVDGHQFVADAAARGAAGALVLRAQPVELPQIVVASVERAMADAARAARAHFTGPVVGVAGSNGKTTAKEMIAAMLAQEGSCLATRGNLNNHLGVPMTLLRLRGRQMSAVIEMGSNRPGDVAQLVQIARPTIGLITNAGAEHLEGFGTLEGVARAEGEMVAGLPSEATAILNADDPFFALWRSSTAATVVSFGFAPTAQFRAEGVHLSVDAMGFSSVFTLLTPNGRCEVRLALAGEHNVRNALGAAAAAMSAGVSLRHIRDGLAAMRAVKGRLQLRRRRCGAWLIDDSYNANPSSVRVGLEVLRDMPGRRWLLLGDMAELGEAAAQSHRELGELARTMGVERLYSYGRLAALAAQSFGAGAQAYEDAQALTQALEQAMQPDVCLLVKGSRVNRLERIVEALAPEMQLNGGVH